MYNYKVNNLKSDRGNSIANQFEIRHQRKVIFQSYQSTVCIIDYKDHSITFGLDWDFSRTTLKWLYHFLNLYSFGFSNKQEIKNMISEGGFIKTTTFGNTNHTQQWVVNFDPNLI